MSKYIFDAEQMKFIQDLGFDGDIDAEEKAKSLYDAVEMHLLNAGIDGDEVNDVGRMCESILDILAQ